MAQTWIKSDSKLMFRSEATGLAEELPAQTFEMAYEFPVGAWVLLEMQLNISRLGCGCRPAIARHKRQA